MPALAADGDRAGDTRWDVPEVDLNLLRVFDALMVTGSVSGAAERLHLSVPATSRALGRLRRAMNDPVLVRAGRGLTPTPFAVRSAARVRALLDAADELVADSADDDPATWHRTFTIRINDALTPVVTPQLFARTTLEAPGVGYRFVAQTTNDPDPLRDGTLDLDVGALEQPTSDLRVEHLRNERFVAVVAAGSRLGRAGRMTVDAFCTHPHVSASRRGLDRGPVDDALLAAGRSRQVVATVPTYPVAALMALGSEIIALLPEMLARHLVGREIPIRIHEIPLDLPPTRVDMRWHRRVDRDRQCQWLRAQMAAVLRTTS